MPPDNINLAKFQALLDVFAQIRPGLTLTETRNSQHKPLDLLVLLILNQSTSDMLADRAFAELKAQYPSYEHLLAEGDTLAVQRCIKLCGLAPTKTRYIFNLLRYLQSQKMLDLELGFLRSMSDEEALNFLTGIEGIGIKSASCLLSFSFGRNTFPIDTHLMRIFRRVGILSPRHSSIQAHQKLCPLVPAQTAWDLHVSLIGLGRTICHPKGPLCSECYLRTICAQGSSESV